MPFFLLINFIFIVDKNGKNALFFAAEFGYKEIAQYLKSIGGIIEEDFEKHH